MQTTIRMPHMSGIAHATPPEVDVVIEVPRGCFLKRGSTGHVDFVSPLPCPFNYGSVPDFVGMEGDLLDALVLGPRLRLGTKTRVKAWGAVILVDRGMTDDKLICSDRPPTASARSQVLRFFHFYAKCKGLLNAWRRSGRTGSRKAARCKLAGGSDRVLIVVFRAATCSSCAYAVLSASHE
jgi:inorganic pyrophosphatase